MIFRIIILIIVFVFSITGAYSQEQDELSDKEISEAVDSELWVHDDVPSHLIDVNTHEGIVTLTGTTNNIMAKERAKEVAMAVKGVRGVVNRIEVDAPDMDDMTLKKNIETALLNDPAANSYQLNVEVNNGVVTLKGEVDSWQEKIIAEHVAKGVTGVTDVINRISFEYDPDRTDIEIENDIRAALENDVRVDADLIAVDINNGMVTLSGTVGSGTEKSIAEMKSWVTGVRSVNTDKLEVNYWARNELIKKQRVEAKTDSEIEQAINDAFFYDPRVSYFNIDVDVNNGVATLSGTVDNIVAKRAALADAKNIVGVYSVKNHLKVQPEDIPGNLTIEKRVNEAFAKNPFVEKFDIDVKAEQGVVTLYGMVDTYFEKYHADDVASAVNGVIHVENRIRVDDDMALGSRVYDYDYYGWNSVYPTPYTGFADPINIEKSDLELKEDIKKQLWWSPFVNESQVDVTVDDGVAILEGTVDTWNERVAATQNAYEAGAKDVKNKLEVMEGSHNKINQ
ncbi:MAG: BON domain-containing protein [bacterium]